MATPSQLPGDAWPVPNSRFFWMRGLAIWAKPPGDPNHIYSILAFYVLQGDIDRGKMKFYLIVNDVMGYIVELRTIDGLIW